MSWPTVNNEVYTYHLNKADKSMINDCPNYMANMYDQEKRALSLSRLVHAANEFIFSNISDLIKSEVLSSWEPWHFWFADEKLI